MIQSSIEKISSQFPSYCVYDVMPWLKMNIANQLNAIHYSIQQHGSSKYIARLQLQREKCLCDCNFPKHLKYFQSQHSIFISNFQSAFSFYFSTHIFLRIEWHKPKDSLGQIFRSIEFISRPHSHLSYFVSFRHWIILQWKF